MLDSIFILSTSKTPLKMKNPPFARWEKGDFFYGGFTDFLIEIFLNLNYIISNT